MSRTSVILVAVLSCSTMLSFYFSIYAQERKNSAGSKEFRFLSLGNAFYSIGYALELLCMDLPCRFWAIRIEYLGLATMPTLFILFTLSLLRDRPAGRKELYAFFVIPVITFICVWTAEYHELYYINPRILSGGPVAIFAFERGFYYKINAVYQTGIMVAGFVVLLILASRSIERKRLQAVTLAAGSLLPLVNSFLYMFEVFPQGIDTAPLALTAACIIYAFALSRLGLFELLPAARALAIDSINEGLFVIDPSGRLQDMNRAARSFPQFIDAKEGEYLPSGSPIAECITALIVSGQCSGEVSIVNSEGQTRHYEVKGYPVLNGNGSVQGTAVLVTDITERTLLIEQLNTLARTDELTGLLNRRSLLELGALEIERSRRLKVPIGVLLADIDFFKRLNDLYGHEAGDMALKVTSSLFLSAFRSIDFVGRYGGEEFVVLLPGADVYASLSAAERFRESVEAAEISYGSEIMRLTVSIGVHSQIAEEASNIEQMIGFADYALYQVKNGGRNKVCLYEQDVH